MRRFLSLAGVLAFAASIAPAVAADAPARVAQQLAPSATPSAAAPARGGLLPGGVAPLSAQAAHPTSIPLPATIPTPAPGGTPVTFGGQVEGKPIPNSTPSPEATSVPTTAPNGNYHSYDQRREIFVTGDYVLQPRVYNEFSTGQRTGKASYSLQGAVEFDIKNLPLLVGGEHRDIQYRHDAGPVTTIGRGPAAFVPALIVRDTDSDGRLGLQLLDPRIYLVASYLQKTRSTGYPTASGYGLGLQKLPDYEAPLSVYFSVLYYPNLNAAFTPAGTTGSLGLRYRDLRYRIGAAIAPPDSPFFIDAGLFGDRIGGRDGSPISRETHISPYVGIGVYTHK